MTVGVPRCPIPGRDGVGIKSQVRMAAEFGDRMQHASEGGSQPLVVRAVKFLKEDIRKYGMTQGCPGCVAANRNAAAVNHSDACRIRIEKLMAEDRHPRYMRAMERLAEAALRETTATTTATNSGMSGDPAASAAIKRPAEQVPEGERVSKAPTPAEVRGGIRGLEGGTKRPRKGLDAVMSQ